MKDRVQRLEEVALAVNEWRTAKCSSPAVIKNGINWARGETCDGENHLEGCAVEVARQALLSVHNALGFVVVSPSPTTTPAR